MYFVGQAEAPSQAVLQSAVDAAVADDDAKLAYVILLVRFTDGEGALNFGDLLLQLQRGVGPDRFERVLSSLQKEARDDALGCMESAEETRRAYEVPSRT